MCIHINTYRTCRKNGMERPLHQIMGRELQCKEQNANHAGTACGDTEQIERERNGTGLQSYVGLGIPSPSFGRHASA